MMISILLRSKIGGEGSLHFPKSKILKKKKKKKKKQPIHTIDQWTAAFQAFVAVYSERFSSATAQLMKNEWCYSERPRGTGTNWKCYDKNFRMLRQRANSMGPNPQ